MPESLWRRDVGSYRGLMMRCAPGTHQAVADVVRQLRLQSGPVLDLASGSGALLARLQDAGFHDLTAVELDAEKFGVTGIAPLPIDLNSEFSKQFDRKFSLITAVEIIEHLNSPRNFLTQIRALLADDGVLILTTPNVSDWLGRIKFFITGTLRYFDDAQYRYNHHISPMPHVQMQHLLDEVGLHAVQHKTVASFSGLLKKICTAPLWAPMRLMWGKSVMGEVNLYALQRCAPKSSRPADWTKLTPSAGQNAPSPAGRPADNPPASS